jgi:fluoride exporter
MSTEAWIAFVVAGAIGAVSRYIVDAVVQQRSRRDHPWGTFVINVSGAFVLGFLTGLALYQGLSTTQKTILGTGFCGAFTTFSTFTFETVRLVEEGDTAVAVLNVVGSVTVAVAAAALGIALASL